MDEAISNFIGITGAPDNAARRVLDICNGDLEQAIQLWFADEELQRNLTNAAASSTAPAASSSSAAPRHRSVGREDSAGVIHIDSDDDHDDVQMSDHPFDDDETAAAEAAAVAAQEDEDAAMAKRLQEELYGGQGAEAEDGVRAPMARTTETLVAPSGFHDEEEDMNMAVLEQMRRRRQFQCKSPLPRDTWPRPGSSPFCSLPPLPLSFPSLFLQSKLLESSSTY